MNPGRPKVVMVTGSYPPMRCGVGDYAFHLTQHLNTACDVTVITSDHPVIRPQFSIETTKSWSVVESIRLARSIIRMKPSLVHIQYPTIGYGHLLGPQFLQTACRIFGIRTIVTVHEFKMARRLRKMSILPFLCLSSGLIFTVEQELRHVVKSLPVLRRRLIARSRVIPVGANILPEAASVKDGPQDSPVLSFFGLFYPGRQIERCIDAFRMASLLQPALRFRMIGDIHPRHTDYFSAIREKVQRDLAPERVEWLVAKESQEIASALATTDICLLPYPDGASFRRTSLLSALSFGIPTLTTRGPDTPPELIDSRNILFASTTEEMAKGISRIIQDRALYRTVSHGALEIASQVYWEKIATAHLMMYEKITGEEILSRGPEQGFRI